MTDPHLAMYKQASMRQVDPTKMTRATHSPPDEVDESTQPESSLWYRGLSWLLALGAGALIFWRSSQEARTLSAKQTMASLPHGRESGAAPRAGSGAPSAVREKVAGGLIPLGKEFYGRFTRDECATRAQALAFVGILSLVPLLLCALAAMSFLIHDPTQMADYVRRLIQQLLPGAEAGKAANDFVQQTHIVESAQTLMQGKWWATFIGAGSLLWAAISLFVSAT